MDGDGVYEVQKLFIQIHTLCICVRVSMSFPCPLAKVCVPIYVCSPHAAIQVHEVLDACGPPNALPNYWHAS